VTAPAAAIEQPRRAWVEQVMGMPVSIHLRGPLVRDAAAESVVAGAIADLHRIDARFSTWRADSQVSRLQRGELTLAQAEADVRDVAGLCEQARQRTEGYFDAGLPGPDGVRRFDPTGLVKGWAVQRCAERLTAALPEHDVLLNAGGDLALACRRTDTPAWSVAVENPLDRSQLLASLRLRTGGVATSGTAARGAHIVDPHSGCAATELASVTVIGPSLLWADVYATAAFARGAGAAAWLATLADHAWLVVAPDGTVSTSNPGT
jgi:FAD:protein FMN transferase